MPDEDTTEKMLSIKQVQDRLGVSRNTVYRLGASGAFEMIKVGFNIRVPQASLDAYLRNAKRAQVKA